MKAKIFKSVEIADIPMEMQKLLRNLANDITAVIEKNETTIHVMNLDMDKVSNVDCVLESLRNTCLLYTSPSPRDLSTSRMPSSA